MEKFLSANVFFPVDFEDKDIQAMTRKNVDIFDAVRIDDNTKRSIKGKAILCIGEDEIVKVDNAILNNKSFWIAGEDSINLWNTTIIVDAIIVDKL